MRGKKAAVREGTLRRVTECPRNQFAGGADTQTVYRCALSMRRLSLVLIALPSLALAANYEVPLNGVDDEQDVLDLEQRGDISADTADVLLELLQQGLDLNNATRDQIYDLPGLSYVDADAIIDYRKTKGRIDDPTELVGAGVLTEDQLLLIAPYIVIYEDGARLPFSGRLRAITAANSGDFTGPRAMAPPFLLDGRVRLPFDLSAGFTTGTTRFLPGPPRYDATRDGLIVDPFAYRIHLPYAYAQWKPGGRKLVVGTFTLGFAERLTLDNTRRFTPNGIYTTTYLRRPIISSSLCRTFDPDTQAAACATGSPSYYGTPDFDWRDPFRGIAGSIEDLTFENGAKLDLYGFLSFQTRSIYQYAIYDRTNCDDPRNDSDSACAAPPVIIAPDPNDLTRDSRLVTSTLPYAYDELIGGGHAAFSPTPQFRVGLTGYGATNFWRGAPLRLDFQEWNRTPFGGPFGAVGVDGRGIFGDVQLTLEATRTFNQEVGGGGGWGLIQRTVFSPKRQELEVSFRYYDDKFNNPYARPPNAPDYFDGVSAANELGARVRYSARLPYDIDVRARLDFWVLPYSNANGSRAGTTNLSALARVDFTGLPWVKPGAWVQVVNRDLASNGYGCTPLEGLDTFSIDQLDVTVTLVGCDYYRLAGRLLVTPPVTGRYLTAVLQGWFSWRADPSLDDRLRNDLNLWAELRSQPFDWLLLRARTRYRHEDLADPTRLEQSLWTYLQATLILPRTLRASLRYDVYAFLDQRDSTARRSPNPEHRFLADVTWSF